MATGSFAAVLLLGCSSDGRQAAEFTPSGSPTTDAVDIDGSPTPGAANTVPTEHGRTATFPAPITTEFQCDCPSHLLGTDGADRAAILRALPLPGSSQREQPSVQVLNADGEIVWRFDDLELSTSEPAVAATSVLALPDAVVAPATGDSLVGLDWSDGSRLWELSDIPVVPRRVPQRPGLFTVAISAFENANGTSRRFHPRVWLRDASSGEARWSATDIDAFTVARDGSQLLAARFGEDGAEIIRVEIPTGAPTSVAVPGWRDRGDSLVLNDDGTISSDIGGQRFTIRVDWEELTVEDLGRTWTDQRPDPLADHPDARIIASQDEAGMVLAATLDDAGLPETVFAARHDGTELWRRPADEVASWTMGKDGDVSFQNVVVHDVARHDPVVMLDLRPGFNELEGAAATGAGPANRVYDLRTGTDLWGWGRSTHRGGQATMPEHGLVLVAEAGPLDATGADPERAPLHAALLDLRNGAAVWDIRGDETTSAGVASDGTFAFVTVRDGPWLLSKAQDG